MAVSEALYRRVALEDPDGKWELVCGQLRSKPPMTSPHHVRSFRLAAILDRLLDWSAFQVRHDQSRLEHPAGSFYVPDVFVVPVGELSPDWETSRELEVFDGPLPFVAEVWSPSTGTFDRTEKLDEYKARGDHEIWLVHPYDRTVTAWRRAPDGTYAESVYTAGAVPLVSLGLVVDMAELFR